jgi:hypothetical protein
VGARPWRQRRAYGDGGANGLVAMGAVWKGALAEVLRWKMGGVGALAVAAALVAVPATKLGFSR